MDLDLHLARYRGATTTTLLRADGIDDHTVATAVRRGDLVRVRRGAFIAPAEWELFRARSAVAVARSRPGEHLSHSSALAAYGLPVVGAGRYDLHLMSPTASRTETRSGHLIVRPGRLPVSPLEDWPDVMAVLPGIAIAQTAAGDVRAGLVAADGALHRRLLTPAQLKSQAAAARIARGAHRVERVLAMADGRSESPGETQLRLALRSLGVATTPQAEFFDARGFVGRVDLHDEANATVYEFDGLEKYAAATGRQALAAEKRREDRLRALGLRVVRVTWDDLCPGRIAELARVPLVRSA